MTFLVLGASAAFAISTIDLRNRFNRSVDSIPAFDKDLLARFEKGFMGLVSLPGSCIFSPYSRLQISHEFPSYG